MSSNITSPSSNCSQQSHVLLKQQLFETNHQLQLLRIHNQNLLSQIGQLKQKQNQLKHLNNIMLQNLNNNTLQVNDQIKLKIQGEFLNNRIKQLQHQLQKYKNGVCDSVDRRVKKIVNQYTQQQQLQQQKRKSRPSLSSKSPINSKKTSDYYQTHQHKYYNIEYNNYINSDRENSTENNNNESQFMLKNNQQFSQERQNYYQKNSNKQRYHNSSRQRYYKNENNRQNKSNSNKNRQNRSNSRQSQSQTESVCVPYNVNLVRNFGKCEKCINLQQIIQDKDQYISQLEERLRMFIQINSNNNNYTNNHNNNNHHNNNINNNSNTPKSNRLQSYTESQSIINSDNSSQQVQQWKLKYLQLLKLYENLKQQYQSLTQNNHNQHHQQKDYNQDINNLQDSDSYQTYTITHTPISGFKKKLTFPLNTNTYKNNNLYNQEKQIYRQGKQIYRQGKQKYRQEKQKDRESQMLQQITNLVNGLGGNNKNYKNNKISQKQQQYQNYTKTTSNNMMFNDKKSRVSQINNMSRISSATNNNKLDNSVFTIKQGVNRYGTNNPFF